MSLYINIGTHFVDPIEGKDNKGWPFEIKYKSHTTLPSSLLASVLLRSSRIDGLRAFERSPSLTTYTIYGPTKWIIYRTNAPSGKG